MTTRLMIGYVLLIVLVLGCAFAVWWAFHNSEHNVRRRKRRARKARRQLGEAPRGGMADEGTDKPR